jgi:hypothetical protein
MEKIRKRRPKSCLASWLDYTGGDFAILFMDDA